MSVAHGRSLWRGGVAGLLLLGGVAAVLGLTISVTSLEAQAAAIQPAPGRLLIARSQLPDPNFFETVVLLLAYDEVDGAFGVVVNRRSELPVGEALPEAPHLSQRQDALYLGGPVSPGTLIVLVNSRRAPATAMQVIPDVHLIRERTGLERLLESDPEEGSLRFYSGYAGWAAGQLEEEIARGSWHLLPGDARWVFSDRPEEVWDRLLRILLGPTA